MSPSCARLVAWRFLPALLLGTVVSLALDLRDAVIVTPTGLSSREQKAVTMLVEEVDKRTHLRWPVTTNWPTTDVPVIAVGPVSAIDRFGGPYAGELRSGRGPDGAEGFRLVTKTGKLRQNVFVIGNDTRGVLFGIGRLLRGLRLAPRQASLAGDLDIATAPKYPLRGQQLGYRPKCNSYDAWDLPVWEQYIRDLAVFGCNAIELIPPRSDDDADSPHFPRPPMEMMTGMSGLADSYGLDVWVWYAAMDPDYSDPKTVEFALKEWGEVFRKLPRVDAVFVPGGDPGHTPPKVLMALLEKQTENLHRYHPKAQMWVSPQGFNTVWMEEFLGLLDREHPAWLTGIVFGPQVRMSLPELRRRVPTQYPIRHYPDITHSRQCEYPVADWDVAYALTEARECINPRPEAEAAIFRKMQPDTIGFLTYSEGCNDDVNKIVWNGMGWDPDAPVLDLLRQYSRYFIGDRYTDNFAQGLLALERNWQGPLLSNTSVETTLAQFQAMEKSAAPSDLKNWRFQQASLRANYDAYVRRRLIRETEQEERALEILRQTKPMGPLAAMDAAEKVLDETLGSRPAPDLRERILELGEALFQSIGMQLGTDKYQAIAPDRGAMLDTMDYPLNNRVWLRERFAKIRALKSDAERTAALREIVEWTNPGPGGFYDDLGNVARQPHLVRGSGFAEDPGAFVSPRADFEEDLVVDEPDERPDGARRISWCDHIETLYDTPLLMRYTGLDPQARYKVRVLYGGDSPKRKIRLTANEGTEIHPLITKPFPYRPVEFAIPAAATKSGTLTLIWSSEPGLGGNGRVCQLSEVWLLKEAPTAGH